MNYFYLFFLHYIETIYTQELLNSRLDIIVLGVRTKIPSTKKMDETPVLTLQSPFN